MKAIHLRRGLAAALFFLAASAMLAETFHGNVKSGIFHRSSCEHYHCKNCTAVFASAEDAVREGYRACRICRPGSGTGQASASVEDAFIGNVNTHKFHRASCRYASCKHCTAKFAARGAAVDAGYAPGRCCNP